MNRMRKLSPAYRYFLREEGYATGRVCSLVCPNKYFKSYGEFLSQQFMEYWRTDLTYDIGPGGWGGGVEVRYPDRDGDADDRTTRLQRLALLLKETQAPCSYDTAAEAGAAI